MTDNRTKNSHPSDLWDYRHAKTLLDVLATYDNEGETFDLDIALLQLCENWKVTPRYYLEDVLEKHETFLEVELTIQALAQHCLQHGREEYQTRISPMDNPLDYPEK